MSVGRAAVSLERFGEKYTSGLGNISASVQSLSDVHKNFARLLTAISAVQRDSTLVTKGIETLTQTQAEGVEYGNRLSLQVRQASAHSDRMARILSRQFYSIGQCSDLVSSSLSGSSAIKKHAAQTLNITGGLKSTVRAVSMLSVTAAVTKDALNTGDAARYLSLLADSIDTLEKLERTNQTRGPHPAGGSPPAIGLSATAAGTEPGPDVGAELTPEAAAAAKAGGSDDVMLFIDANGRTDKSA